MTKELFKHMHWADAEVWHAILSNPQAEKDTRIRDLLHHIHLVQHAFLQVWTKKPVKFPEVESFKNLADISKWGSDYWPKVTAFLEEATEADLESVVVLPWAKEFEQTQGKSFETTTLNETMFQVTSHSAHHRGQVQARFRDLDGKPPLIDYIAWVWFGRPEADWPQS